MEEDEPFDALSGPSSAQTSAPSSRPPPSAAFAHTAPVGGVDGVQTSGAVGPGAPAPSRPSGSPPADAFGLPQRWSKYANDMETHRAESSLGASKSTAAPSEQQHPLPDSITPSKQQPGYYTNYGLMETPSPSGVPSRSSLPLPAGPDGPYGFKRSDSYDTAKLIEKYAAYRAPPPTIRNPSPLQSPRDRDIRDQAMKVLDLVDDRLNVPLDVRRSESGGFRASSVGTMGGELQPYAVRRTASGNVVHEPNEPSAAIPPAEGYFVRRTLSSGSNGKRVPAALAGLNLNQDGRTPHNGRGQPGRYSFTDPNFRDDDHISDDEDDIIRGPEALDDLVDELLDHRGRGAQDPLVDYRHSENRTASSRYSANQERNSSWSSRYMYNWSHDGLLDRMDRESNRHQRQSARNMFASSADSLRNAVSVQKGKVFGSGFSFRQNHVFGQKKHMENEVNLRTVWKDVGEDECLVPSTQRKTWQEAMLNKHRRRRYMAICLIVLSCVVIVCAVMFGIRGGGIKSEAAQFSGGEIGKPVTIYVTSDVPYDHEEEIKIKKDLKNLPRDAEFVVHLGNIQDASVSMCPKTKYSEVSSVLQQSPVPIFMLPGEEDWVFCPDPEAAFAHWMNEFALFEENFDQDIRVFRPRNRPENFCVLRGGVLFVGLHLVGGPINDTDDWSQRGLDMLEFYFGMLNLHKDSFRAIVLMGNARPGPAQQTFFDGLVTGIRPVGKPIAYVHANSGQGKVVQYTPFDDYPEVVGIEIRDGGINPPLRLTVGFGERPFKVG